MVTTQGRVDARGSKVRQLEEVCGWLAQSRRYPQAIKNTRNEETVARMRLTRWKITRPRLALSEIDEAKFAELALAAVRHRKAKLVLSSTRPLREVCVSHCARRGVLSARSATQVDEPISQRAINGARGKRADARSCK